MLLLSLTSAGSAANEAMVPLRRSNSSASRRFSRSSILHDLLCVSIKRTLQATLQYQPAVRIVVLLL